MNIKKHQINLSTKTAILTGFISSYLFHPMMVLAADATDKSNPLNKGADWLLSLLTGPLATSVAVIGLVVIGYLGLSGRMAPKTVIGVFIALLIIFGAPQLVDLIKTATVGS